jgi:protein kinase C substrate 80K-H
VKTEEGDALREEVSKLEGEVRDLERRIEDLENTNNSNFGPQGELFALKGRCFTRTVNQYVYEMCPYGDAKQKEGHSSVNLGRWDRAESTDNGGFKFFFRNGQRCWNGPERSLTVTVTCGHEEEVLSVDEPAVCEYVMDFVTPAACDATYAQQLKLDLEDEESSARSEL